MQSNKKILVTGGNGFLGSAIVRELKAGNCFPECEITVLDVQSACMHPNINYLQGDIRRPDDVRAAVDGADIVIHSAAIVDWGTRTEAEVMAVNYQGTRNIIEACHESGVDTLVFTSTLDVVYTGKPLRNIDESMPYPEKPVNAYCKSKALAEQLVMEANGDSLKTAVIRPADVWGEGDPYHIDSLVNMAKSGFYVRLGNGKSVCQHVYVGNVASAHLQLAAALAAPDSAAAGNVYFITDPGSHNFFSFFDCIVTGAGYRIWPKNLWLPYRLAYGLASISEAIAVAWRPIKHYNPKFSRFAVDYTCTDFTFSSDRATREFAYKQKYTLPEAIEKTVLHYRLKK